MPENRKALGSQLKFADVKRCVAEHLETALDVSEFSITFAKHEPEQHVWKVNVEFKERISGSEWPTSALFAIDAGTGEVREFKKGHTWTF